jgi:hypothetical protein
MRFSVSRWFVVVKLMLADGLVQLLQPSAGPAQAG